MDRDSLIAGLLHDTVEDNPGQITFEEIGVSLSWSLDRLSSVRGLQHWKKGSPVVL